MSNVYSMKQLKDDLDRKYGPLVFETDEDVFELRQVIRLREAERNDVVEALKSLEGRDENSIQEIEMREILEFVLKTAVGAKGEAFVSLFEGDLVALQEVFQKWIEHTQAGEASASSS